jgi:hypothetical protein
MELGNSNAAAAVAIFRNHLWRQELDRCDPLEPNDLDPASPDLTFTALPSHMIVTAETADAFNVEVCLPARRSSSASSARRSSTRFRRCRGRWWRR